MKLVNAELYTVLKNIGATEEDAIKAAESVAEHHEQFHQLDKKLDRLTVITGLIFLAIVVPQVKSLMG